LLSDPAVPSLPNKDKLPPDNSYLTSVIVNVMSFDSYFFPSLLATTLKLYTPIFTLSFHETLPLLIETLSILIGLIDQVTPLVTGLPSFFRTHCFSSDPASPSLPDNFKLPPDNSYFDSGVGGVGGVSPQLVTEVAIEPKDNIPKLGINNVLNNLDFFILFNLTSISNII
jgi:hypothetical protein